MGAALVTGATGGIGSAVVAKLLEHGHTVFAGVRGEAVVPAGATRVRMDVTDPAAVRAAAEQVAGAVGGLDAVVNNAGLIVQGPLELVPPEHLRRQFEVNTLGPAYVTQAFLPLLRAGHGRVVNVSAPSARVPFPMMAPISASKAALQSLSEAQRLELAAWSVPVILIEPSATDTAIFDKAAAVMARGDLYRDHLAGFEGAMARQKLAPVEPVARAIVTAVEARRPKRRYAVGRDARLAGLLARLPIGLRERAVVAALGLGKVRAVAPV